MIHGLAKTYNHGGCRCRQCLLAAERYWANRVDRIREGSWQPWRSPIGLARRLQALQTLGWSPRAIAQHCDLSESALQRIMHTAPDIMRANSRAFTAIPPVYEKLWDRTPPATCWRERQTIGRAKAEATRRGYAPPLAWDDETIDDPAARPQHMIRDPRTVADKAAARAADVARLGALQLSAAQIAERLGTTPRTVIRDRARNRDTAA